MCPQNSALCSFKNRLMELKIENKFNLYVDILILMTLVKHFGRYQSYNSVLPIGQKTGSSVNINNSFCFKILRINTNKSKNNSNGQVLNLISNDIANIENMFNYFSYIFVSPLMIVGNIYLLVTRVHVYMLCGLPLVLIFLLVNTYLGHCSTDIR